MKRILLTLLIFGMLTGLTAGTPHSELIVEQWSMQGPHLEIVIGNPSSSYETGYLVVDVWDGTQTLCYGFMLEDVPPKTDLWIWISHPQLPQITDVRIYEDDFPDGIVEAPEPISNSVTTEERPRS